MTERSIRRRGVLTRDDLKLWAHVTRGVDVMQGKAAFHYQETLEQVVTVPEPADASPLRGKADALKPQTPPLAPLERKLRQRLTRGQKPVDGVIDLHGMRQAEAHGALISFIHRAQHEGRSVVLVITGKGLPGEAADYETRGVLRRMVPHWLADPALRRHVLGFEPAARGHGGDGALYVRIRKTRINP
jgi:DNA-nicking Smr family endonuclease